MPWRDIGRIEKKEKKEKSFLIYWLRKLIPFVLKSLVLQTKKTGRCNMPPSRRVMFGCNCCYDIVGKLLIVGLKYIKFCTEIALTFLLNFVP